MPDYMNIVDTAAALAMRFHSGQINDKDGEPYILHPHRVYIRVRDAGFSDIYCAVAWLHDTIEDTDITGGVIQDSFHFDNSIIIYNAVCAITKRMWNPDETNKDYYYRVKANDIARIVKIHDIHDNFGRTHLVENEATRLRLGQKYSLGLSILTEA